MARFRDSVQLRVKMSRSGVRTPSSAAASSRQLSTMRPACSESLCPPRPGFAPTLSIAPVIARITCAGLGKDVAALSR